MKIININKKKNTRKKNNKSNNTNNKTRVKRCMENFVEKKVNYWLDDYDKVIKKLEKKKNLTKEEQLYLIDLKKKRKNQLNNLTKQYKLYNCNINCKNTLLEPGPPNEIPKTMRKEYNNSKSLIKIFTKRRKEIFKNKSNVLKDNFYENIPEQEKKQLLKEGAISECVPPLSLAGGSIIFKDGTKNKTDETFKGNPFFRKVFYYSDPPRENQLIAAENEYKIAKILIENPFPNIVTFYNINKDYVEMEELDITTSNKLNKKELIDTMRKTKDFLQSLGIMYIDWKPDNIGISKDGTYKLFDFDVSGLIDLKTNEWIVKPLEYWNYNKAIENGFKTPKQIDDFSFEYGIVGIEKQPF
jgi:serine/threonine protein kinase